MKSGVVPTTRLISFSLLGGFTGAIALGIMAYMMPIPNTGGAPFFVAAAMMMGMGSAAFLAGWMLHLVTGLVVGFVFGVFTTKISNLRISSLGRGLGFGVVTGVIVWVIFFMPMMAMLMPALMGMSMMVAGSIAAHVVYGLILGGVAALPILYKPRRRTFADSSADIAIPAISFHPGAYCTGCGVALLEEDQFCPHCGRPKEITQIT